MPRYGRRRPISDLLRLRIIEPILEGAASSLVANLASNSGLLGVLGRFTTKSSLQGAYHRLLREEIRLYARNDEEVAGEIQDLWRFMAE